MDQIKTGKFIAERRRHKNYTQRQLAEILGISDKTVSKWECGNGFPEVSLLLPLCEELEISVNELLSGETVPDAKYRIKAEENMMNMIKEKEENKKRLALTTVTGIISTVSFVTLIITVCVYTDVMSTAAKLVLIAIACAVFAAGVCVAMHGERTVGYYKCAKCGEHFIPTRLAYSMGMHLISVRWLKCPKCKRSGWCKKVLSKESE